MDKNEQLIIRTENDTNINLSQEAKCLVQSLALSDLHAKLLQLDPTLCDPWDRSPPVPLSMGFSRQEYRSGLPFPPPGDLSNPGIEHSISNVSHTGRRALYH